MLNVVRNADQTFYVEDGIRKILYAQHQRVCVVPPQDLCLCLGEYYPGVKFCVFLFEPFWKNSV